MNSIKFIKDEMQKKEIKNQHKNILNKDGNTIKYSKSYSILSKKSKESFIPNLMINEMENPSTFCKDDTFGIAITGPTFEKLFNIKKWKSIRSYGSRT